MEVWDIVILDISASSRGGAYLEGNTSGNVNNAVVESSLHVSLLPPVADVCSSRVKDVIDCRALFCALVTMCRAEVLPFVCLHLGTCFGGT